MELSEAQKYTVKQILFHADGEDMDEIIQDVGFKDYLLHSLIMQASDDTLEYFFKERKELHTKISSNIKVVIKLDDAKKQAINLIKSQYANFHSDTMMDIKKAELIDDIESFINVYRFSEEVRDTQIEKVEKAHSINEIVSALDTDEPGNIFFECENLVLSSILGIKVLIV